MVHIRIIHHVWYGRKERQRKLVHRMRCDTAPMRSSIVSFSVGDVVAPISAAPATKKGHRSTLVVVVTDCANVQIYTRQIGDLQIPVRDGSR